MVELLSLLYLYCHRHTTLNLLQKLAYTGRGFFFVGVKTFTVACTEVAGKSSSLISDGASEEI